MTKSTSMKPEIETFNNSKEAPYSAICNRLAHIIDTNLNYTESKIWHAHPVWFIDGNPIVGYGQLKRGLRLMFWSGQSFDEPELKITGSFKASETIYKHLEEIDEKKLVKWLKISEEIQWDYKNIVKRKGKLERLV